MRKHLQSAVFGALLAVVCLSATLVAAGITRISFGSSLPTNCVSGNLYVKTSATAGVYWCSTPGSPGTWTGIGAAGTVTTSGSPASGNLTKFSGATAITNGDLSGDVTTSGTLATTIASGAVTLAKIQNAAANSKILCSGSSGSGASYSECTAGTGITIAGTTITASGGSGGGGSLILVESHTASTSASLDFTSCFSSTYDEYAFQLVGVVPSTNSVELNFRVSTNGGSSYVATNSYHWSKWSYNDVPSTGVTGDSSATLIAVSSTNVDNTASEGGVNGFIYMLVPNSGSAFTVFNGQLSYIAGGGVAQQSNLNGVYAASTAVNAVQFFESIGPPTYTTGGNIASGTIRCYGVAH